MIQNRPPIIVILGHVDHGKTTLLDFLRHSSLAAKEAGGITQTIRSFQILTKDFGPMTFIDTPGHEAFAKMRQRGSKVADMAILVVAADDGVQPQTRQSIDFIKSSNIPFIVAINKTDLKTADPDRVKTQLTEENIVVEDFGGDVPTLMISAKTGKNITELLELVNLMTSLNPPQSDPSGKLEAIVLESRMDSKKGPLTSVVIKNGTLKVGQELFQAESLSKVKAIIDSDGQNLKQAPPSVPVEILGLSHVIEVGTVISDTLVASTNHTVNQAYSATSPDLPNFIIKADVAGSLEAVLLGLHDKINVISSGTGEINENDVLMAHTSGAQILGFNIRVSTNIAKLAETEKVNMKFYSIIYELFQDIEDLLHPVVTEKIVGKATILADFKYNSDRVAGCRVTEGYLEKATKIKILRDEKLIGETRIKSLQQGKTIVEKVKQGTEFGAVFSPYVDFKVGDAIIATIG